MRLPSVAEFTQAVLDATACPECGKQTVRLQTASGPEMFDAATHCALGARCSARRAGMVLES